MNVLAAIAWRMSRIELLVALLVSAGLGVVMIALGSQLRSLTPSAGPCLEQLRTGLDLGADCPAAWQFTLLSIGSVGSVIGLMGYVPWMLGGLVGSQVVAREIERRTAGLSWWLSGRRVRWLVARSWLPAVVIGIGALAMGVGATQLVAARYPWLDVWHNLRDLGLWGPAPVLASLCGFAAGLAVGSIVGRQILSLVLTGATCAVLINVVGLAAPYGTPQTVVSSKAWQSDGAWAWWQGLQAPDGRLVSFEDAEGTIGRYRSVNIGVTGDRTPEVVGRQAVFMLALTAAALAVAGVAVDRRRRFV